MTGRRPPPGRPPGFETYRPSQERYPPERPASVHPNDPRAAGYPEHYPPQQPYPPQQRYPAAPPQDDRYGYDAGRGRYAPPPHERSRPRRAGLGSFVIYGLLGLVAMVAGAVAFAIMALPANFVRDRVVAAVKEKTGRDLVIGGAASFTVYPAVGVSLADVSLSGAPGVADAKPLVAMKALDISVALWPLFRREVEIATLVLREPVFNLIVDGKGRRSWDFAAADDREGRVRFAQAEAGTANDAAADAPSGTGRRSPLKLGNLKLEDVRIDNGTLVYHDQRSGTPTEVSAIQAKVALAALTAPLSANGSLAWRGETVKFDGALTSLADALDSRPAKLKLTLGARALDASFEGSAKLEDKLFAEGILSAKTVSVRALTRWLGDELPPSDGFGPLSAKGLLRGTADKLSFSTAEIVLDRTTARGEITVDTTRARPLVGANLKLTELDLNTYASTGPTPAPPSAPQRAAPERKAQSIEDLLGEEPPGPRVKGYTKRAGWDDEPFNLTLLGLVDANAKLSIGKLTVDTIRLDQSDLTVALKNRVMTTALDKVLLYEGTARGTVVVDGTSGSAATLNANLTFDGISALPLLRDAAELDKLAGKGRLALALAGKGRSERQIVDTLAGRIEFAFTDGAIIGINIPGMVRSFSKGDLGGLKTAPSDKTDFSELSSTWTVTNGVAENQDLKMVSPLLRVTGSGRVGLPKRDIDYLLKPKVVASLSGQGGAQDLTGLEIPVRVHGPLDDPKYTPDLSQAFKDPNKAMETIKELGGSLKGKNANEIVDSLIGGTKEERKAKKEQGKKLLEQFLNGQ